MTGQIKFAQNGKITPAMYAVSQGEQIPVENIRASMANGHISITAPIPERGVHVAYGRETRIKVACSIGTTVDGSGWESELIKAKAVAEKGVNMIFDLSLGEDMITLRQRLLEEIDVPICTAPIYQAAMQAVAQKGRVSAMTPGTILAAVEEQASAGVEMLVIHAGFTIRNIELLRKQKRAMPVVSRGAAFLVPYCLENKKENPLYLEFDRVCEIAAEHDTILLLCDGMRSGSVADSMDSAEMSGLCTLSELHAQALEAGVQTIVDGPSHGSLDKLEAHIRLAKQMCKGAPYYVAAIATDRAPAFDHISGAIGSTVAALAGADMLAAVTPAEHIGLPDVRDQVLGVITARIVATAADLQRGIGWQKEVQMAQARNHLDWDAQAGLSLDSAAFLAKRNQYGPTKECTMCGKYCALNFTRKYFECNE